MPSVLFLIRIKFKVQMCNNSHNGVPGTFVFVPKLEWLKD